MKTADVILIQPPAWGINTPPLATAQLAAYLRSKGLKVYSYDLNIDLYHHAGEEDKKAWGLEYYYLWENSSWVDEIWESHRDLIAPLIDAIAISPAQIIGLSVYCSSYLPARKLVKEIKERCPNKTIVMGGPHVSRFFAGNATIESDDVPVDFIVDGEGEKTLWELYRTIIDGTDVGQIPGILYKGDDQVIFTGERELIKEINNLPFPDFSDFDLSLYSEKNKLPVASSRGCVNRCIFCNEFPFWKKFRGFSGDYIFNNIKQLKSKFPRVYYFEFNDSLVNGNISALERFCNLVIESGLQIQWYGNTIFRKEMTYDLQKKMVNSGCVGIGYGLETASPRLISKVGKHMAQGTNIDQVLIDGEKAGLPCCLNFMFGLPGETDEDAEENIKFIRRHRDRITAVNPSASFCSIMPGSPAGDCPEKFGIDYTGGALYWEGDRGNNNYLVRMERFENFCQAALDLGITSTYPHPKLLNRNELLANYYLAIGDEINAQLYLKQSLEEEGFNHHLLTLYLDLVEKHRGREEAEKEKMRIEQTT